MARVALEAFGEQELARIYMTPKLRDARRAESVLEERGVDFVVLAEPFGRTLLGLPRTGASFYVLAGHADYCAELLTAAGLERGIVGPDDPSAD